MTSDAFVVDVTFYPQDGDEPPTYVASCDALGLTTEAATLDRLVERVRLVAPELYELNFQDGEPAPRSARATPSLVIRHVMREADGRDVLQRTA